MRTLAFSSFLALASLLHAADPSASFYPWSAVEKIDLEKLASGSVATTSHGSMKFARGISTQAVFVVNATPETARMTTPRPIPTLKPFKSG